MTRYYFLFLGVAVFFGKHSLQAQTYTPVPFDCRDSIPVWMAARKVPAVGVGIIENGRVKEVTVFGTLPDKAPYPVNTLFNVASLTKPVTAMLTLKLVNAGQWDLDEPLSKYWIDPDKRAYPLN
ncbi:MAG TPA: serine hydrolase domain-containing protein [Puia sp.]|nr:serine hydrolase domain-containing protein [Puia sp.]